MKKIVLIGIVGILTLLKSEAVAAQKLSTISSILSLNGNPFMGNREAMLRYEKVVLEQPSNKDFATLNIDNAKTKSNPWGLFIRVKNGKWVLLGKFPGNLKMIDVIKNREIKSLCIHDEQEKNNPYITVTLKDESGQEGTVSLKDPDFN